MRIVLTKIVSLLAAGLLASILGLAPAIAASHLSLRIAGPEEVVLPAGVACQAFRDAGGTLDLPDQPMRAIRNRAGEIRVFASAYANLPFKSANLSTIQHDGCRPMMQSPLDPDPARYAGRNWIVAPYPMPNGTIYALVHEEYWGGTVDPLCKQRLNGSAPWSGPCVYLNIVAARSIDGGKSFLPLAGDAQIVAARPERFTSTMNRAGYRDPSNIVFNPRDKYYYFILFADRGGPQELGSCILRTRAPGIEPWLAWDGQGFNARLAGPYRGGTPRTCMPITILSLKALLWDPKSGQIVGSGMDMRAGGFFYMTSTDLVHWSPSTLLQKAVASNHWVPGGPPPIAYPSMLDPTSSSPAFDTIGDHPYIYYVKFQTTLMGKIAGRQRDIVRVPLAIQRN
ncbi:hypothetical protein FHS31_001678 [Sphingomonas vulcanisoli]|uniref:DUF4185 domain-containing protein n=1 Tax=Sphingomonas vulcanisoli TaxID=1658060 RepID=A0ABX0TRB7_9SPHN|nr:hypothetical protein [Sphingomonas vulcanisoli]NIJ08068.1 hypothetical protein [Sphingomonas vulcanisoli]